MSTILKKMISTSLLFLLAFSCFGLNLGMIGQHVVAQHTDHAYTNTTAHDCCDSISGATTPAAGAMDAQMDHHRVSAVLASMGVFLFLAITFFVGVIHRWDIVQKDIRIWLYMRERWRQICHEAILFVQLFSQGILHPITH